MPGVPQKVAADAGCSVLLVKEEQPISRILAYLDQTYISQESLEILNQMITIHQAELEVIGVNPESGLKKEVYTRLIQLGDYYQDRGVKIQTRLVELADLGDLSVPEGRRIFWLSGWAKNLSSPDSSRGTGWAGSWPGGSHRF